MLVKYERSNVVSQHFSFRTSHNTVLRMENGVSRRFQTTHRISLKSQQTYETSSQHVAYICSPTNKTIYRERSGSVSVVVCLTRDRGAVSLSLADVNALWSLSITHLSQFSAGSTQEDQDVKNQIKQTNKQNLISSI